MIVKEATYKACGECGSRHRLTEEAYGCDCCKKPITLNLTSKGHHDYLEAAVFKNGAETKHLHFCSWKCALKAIKTVKTDYFVTLPYLLYDETKKGLRAKDFFAEIKRMGASTSTTGVKR